MNYDISRYSLKLTSTCFQIRSLLGNEYFRRHYNNNVKKARKGQSDLSLHFWSFVTYQLSLSFCPLFLATPSANFKLYQMYFCNIPI